MKVRLLLPVSNECYEFLRKQIELRGQSDRIGQHNGRGIIDMSDVDVICMPERILAEKQGIKT